jgi:ubiquinone/menaquinone biosynthesis C-methylase UbiE
MSDRKTRENKSYYDQILSANKLKRCYELVPERVKQYLNSEIEYVLTKIHPHDLILELGCGYGRVIPRISRKAKHVIGIDISGSSLRLAGQMLNKIPNKTLIRMDAVNLAFKEKTFDGIFCIQNGISAFHVNPVTLIRESIRVTKPGGIILYSTYSVKFWNQRLEWFRLQSDAGLIGKIDFKKTGNGTIVCRDGFTATTFTEEDFRALTSGLNVRIIFKEIDQSSLFCEIYVL